jgi:O-antigen/teichoic acid export membrane protein
LYSAAYNLCQYVQAVVIVSVGQAIMPMYMRIWDQKGAKETSTFIARSLRSYVLLGIPVIGGLAAVGPELLPSLASTKYAGAASLIPWIIGGMVLDGTNSMVGAGLFLHRKTRHIMAIVLSCAALNVGLNLLLVPRIGIHGSAIATLISYAVAAAALAIAGHHLLPVQMPWATLVRAGICSAIMYGTLIFVLPGRGLLTVGARIVVGAPLYAAMMMLIDRDVRELAGHALARLRRQRAGSAA